MLLAVWSEKKRGAAIKSLGITKAADICTEFTAKWR